MSLPNDITAVDTETITDSFWNDLVENYEAIFDGSAFDDGTVKTKFGTVALYVRLHSGLTSQPITLIVGTPYLVIMLSSDSLVKDPRITQGGSAVLGSFSSQAAYVFTPGASNLLCTTQGDGDWDDIEVRFLIIKLDNNSSEWANTASIPYPGLTFADEEVLQATKVNKVISNVNSSKTVLNTLGIEKLNISNNTKTSMIPVAFLNTDEVTTPASIPDYKVVSELAFDIPANLEGCAILISVSAEYLWSGNDYVPDRVDIRDSEEDIVATQDFIIFTEAEGENMALPVNILTTGLTEGSYTVEVVYYLGSSGTHVANTSYPGIINITVMVFGA